MIQKHGELRPDCFFRFSERGTENYNEAVKRAKASDLDANAPAALKQVLEPFGINRLQRVARTKQSLKQATLCKQSKIIKHVSLWPSGNLCSYTHISLSLYIYIRRSMGTPVVWKGTTQGTLGEIPAARA